MKKLHTIKIIGTTVFATAMTMTSFAYANTNENIAFRTAIEAKGGTVNYDDTLKKVTANYNGTEINFIIGSGKINVNGTVVNEQTYLERGNTMINKTFLENKLNNIAVSETKLEIGTIKTYDFGNIKLNAYLTNDVLNDVTYIVEKGDNVVIIEGTAFHNNVDELAEYIKLSGKNIAGALMAYHPNGYDKFHTDVYATENAVNSWQQGGSIRSLVDGFVVTFGDGIATEMPQTAKTITAGQNITLGEIEFHIIEAGDDAYSVEIPEINCIYRHMMGSKCHNILTSLEHIDAMIAEMKQYKQKNYALILTSHYEPETLSAVDEKINYLETVKQIALQSNNAEEFKTNVKQKFADYTGENYIDMTAGFLFP